MRVHGEFTIRDDGCEFEWKDGWGHHHCYAVKGHEGRHMCPCDATKRQ